MRPALNQNARQESNNSGIFRVTFVSLSVLYGAFYGLLYANIKRGRSKKDDNLEYGRSVNVLLYS